MLSARKVCFFILLFLSFSIHLLCKDKVSNSDAEKQGRKFHIINLSLPRTGSGSLWGLFSKNYRSSHEFMRNETINAILDYREQKIARHDLDSFLLQRDKAEILEMDSANFLYLEPGIVVSNFPDAKFYLAIRDGRTWIISFLDMLFANFGPQKRAKGMDMRWVNRYGKVITPRFDASLFADKATFKALVEPLLQDFADFWGKSTYDALRALKEVPAGRRMIIYTRDLNDSVTRIATFAGIDKSTLDLDKVHLNRDNRPSEIENLLGSQKIVKATADWQAKIDRFITENKLIEK